MENETQKLEILRCAQHGYWAIGTTDMRITPGKCCGSWTVVKDWPITDSLKADVLEALGIKIEAK